MSPSRKDTDTFLVAPPRLHCDDTRTASATISDKTAAILPRAAWATNSHLLSGSPHIPLPTTASALSGAVVSYKHAHLRSVLKRPSEIREFCIGVVWDKQQGSNMEGRLGPGFRSATVGSSTARIPTQKPLDHRTFRPSIFREVSIPCGMNGYLLRTPRRPLG